MPIKFLLSAGVTAVTLLVFDVHSTMQSVPYRSGLRVRLVWMNVEYGDQRVAGQGIILQGEPLVFDVGVINRHEGGLVGAEVDWTRRISAHWWRGRRFESTSGTPLPLQCEPRPIQSVRVTRVGDYLELGARGFQFVRCRVDPAAIELAAGVYTVTIDWVRSADMQRLREEKGQISLPTLLSGFTEFEFREVVTNNDQLDLLNHLATRAYFEGDYDRALELSEDVLRRQPTSITALSTRGRTRVAQGACKQAISDWQTIVSNIEGNRDVGNLAVEGLSAENQRNTADHWRQQVRALKCP